MNNIESSITDPTDFSIFQPHKPKHEIEREALVSTIEEYFNDDVKQVFVSGEAGMGKTILLSQFIRRNKSRSIAIFIDEDNINNTDYDSLIKDLYIQISVYLDDRWTDECIVNESTIKSKISSLQYNIQRAQKTIYIAVDGIDSFAADDLTATRFMDLLPKSSPYIKYLFSVSHKKHTSMARLKNSKEFSVPLLSTDEALQLLPSIDRTTAMEFLRSFKKTPLNIASLSRLIDSGANKESILQQIHDNKDSMYATEWENNKEKIEKAIHEISILTFHDSVISIDDLSEISGISKSGLLSTLSSISFIAIETSSIRFASPDFREFCRKRLSEYKDSSIERIVNHLSKNSDENLTAISTIFQGSKNYPEIISILNNENLSTALDKNKSVTELMRQINLGFNAAKNISSEPDLLRFSHMKNIVWRLEESSILKSELSAHLADDDVQFAIDIATSARSNEEKLQLLSMIAKYQKDKGRSIDPSISQQIDFLYSCVEPELIGLEKTLEIALELFPVMPDQSLDLINRIDPLGYGGENNSDYAFFRFSLSAFINRKEDLDLLDESTKNLSDERRKVISALKLFKRGTPASSILNRFKDDKKPGDELFILRNWLNAFPDATDNYLLASRAISLAISTTNYSANASFYCDMAKVMLAIEDHQKASEIYQKILSQLNSARRLGPTAQYIQLSLSMHQYERKYSLPGNRLLDTYNEAVALTDKAICLLSLCLIDLYILNNNVVRFPFDIKREKEKLFSLISEKTADQFEIIKEALKVEVNISIKNALAWAENLNTQLRRSEATQLIISQVCETGKDLKIDSLCQTTKSISRESLRQAAFSSILKYCNSCSEISENDFRRLKKLYNTFSVSKYLCLSGVQLLQIFKKQSFFNEDQAKSQREAIISSWENLDGGWRKIDLGFTIHNKVKSIDQEFSNIIKEKSIELRQDGNIHNEEIAYTLLDTVDLSIRCYFYMIRDGVDTDEYTNMILGVIALLPSSTFKCREIARLCSAYQIFNKHDKVAHLVENKLLAILDDLDKSTDAYRSCIYWAAPVIAKYSLQVLNDYYLPINDKHDFQDMCTRFAIEYFYKDVLLGDPFDPIKNHVPDITLKGAKDVVSLLKMVNCCQMTYFLLKTFVSILNKKIKEKSFTHPQYSFLISEIEQIIEVKIKTADYIKHSGYYLCSLGLVLHLKQEKKASPWNEIIARAQEIPNASDVSFILSSLAEIMPAALKELRLKLFKEAVTLIDSLPSDLDKLGRYEDLSEKSRAIDKQFAKDCIKRAIDISASNDSEEYEKKRTSLIDVSYSLDKDFTESLSSIADADPAKKECIERNVRNKINEISADIQFNSDESTSINVDRDKRYPGIAWSHLGKLNASNYKARKRIDYINYLSDLVEYDAKDMYPLLSYYITMVSLKSRNQEQCKKNILPIFSVLMKNITLFSDVYKTGSMRRNTLISSVSESQNIVINTNEREKVSGFVKSWIQDKEITEIQIVDPYFHLEDFLFIGDVIDKDPNFTIKIFTVEKMKKIMIKASNNNIEDIISEYWQHNVSSDSIPNIEITFASVKGDTEEDFPIHDRWWISESYGLRMGTSTNSWGNKISEISILNSHQIQNIDQTIGGFINRTQKFHDGKKIRYYHHII